MGNDFQQHSCLWQKSLIPLGEVGYMYCTPPFGLVKNQNFRVVIYYEIPLDNFFQCLSLSTFPPIHMTKNHAILFFSLVPHINLLFNAILVWVKGFPLGIKLSPFLSVINICGVINNMKSNQQRTLFPSFCSILLTLIFYHIGWLLPLFFLSPNRKREKRDEAVWEFPYVTVLFFFNCIVEWNKLHSFPCAKTSKVCLIISSFFSNIQKHLKLVIKLYVWDVLKF